MKNKHQVLLIHGGTTFGSRKEYLKYLKEKSVTLERIASQSGWKSELQDDLGKDFVVYTPQMPNKTNASYKEWKMWFEKIVDKLNDDITLIGHSLGALFIVKYLSENVIIRKVRKTHLLGTPYDDSHMENEPLYSFSRRKDLKGLLEQAGELYFYHSEDDFAVLYTNMEEYEKRLSQAYFRKYKNMKHFNSSKVPGLVRDVKG